MSADVYIRGSAVVFADDRSEGASLPVRCLEDELCGPLTVCSTRGVCKCCGLAMPPKMGPPSTFCEAAPCIAARRERALARRRSFYQGLAR